MEDTTLIATLIAAIVILVRVIEYFFKQVWPIDKKNESKIVCPMGGSRTIEKVNDLHEKITVAETLRLRDAETIIMQQEKFAEHLEKISETQERVGKTLERVSKTLDEIVEKQRAQETENKIEEEVEKRVKLRAANGVNR